MATQVHIDANIGWRVYQDPQTQSWIGVCEALGQTALGDSFNDLVYEGIRSLMHELFTDLAQSNELEAFLGQHGWRLRGPMPRIGQDEQYEFDVPFHLLKDAGVGGGGSRVSR